MDEQSKPKLIELAYRSNGGMDVTLVWKQDTSGDEAAIICVCDRREGAYFEIRAKPFLALDVFYHPFAYRKLSTFDYEDNRLAA